MSDNIPWAQTFDFTEISGPWQTTIGGGIPYSTWQQGIGWNAQCNPNNFGGSLAAIINFDFGMTLTLTKVSVTYDETPGDNSAGAYHNYIANKTQYGGTNAADEIATSSVANVQHGLLEFSGSTPATGLSIGIWAQRGNCNSGAASITGLVVEGIGLNPFLKHKGPRDCPFCDAAIGAEEGGS